MIFRERKSQKSEDEKRLESALSAYENRFGEPYVFTIGEHLMSIDETITDIEKKVKSGPKQKIKSQDDNLLY